VVFNEMKGSYSSPDTMLRELSQQSLYPDVTYGLDSGGDPKHIPDLTYEQLQAFHERHYHPTNVRDLRGVLADLPDTEMAGFISQRCMTQARYPVNMNTAAQNTIAFSF
jgi:Zn-dependent M16 (insulinase) family peptidase